MINYHHHETVATGYLIKASIPDVNYDVGIFKGHPPIVTVTV